MIRNINEFINNEFDVVGEVFSIASPIDPLVRFTFFETSELIELNIGRSQRQYDAANVEGYKTSPDFLVLGNRALISTDEYFNHLTATPDVPRYTDFYRQLVSHRPISIIDGITSNPYSKTPLRNLNGGNQYDVNDVFKNVIPSKPDYLIHDYMRLIVDGRTKLTHEQLITASESFDVIGGPYIIKDPDPVTGELFKVFGTVQQLGSVPSHPTNVMIVNRSAGSLSTITVSPDPVGRFVKYYKDVPDDSTFMVIGLWDPTQTPYYEPVILDRVIATKL